MQTKSKLNIQKDVKFPSRADYVCHRGVDFACKRRGVSSYYVDMPKEKESNLGDHRVRKYDSEVGRFLAIDPLWEKYHTMNPFQYSGNSPIDRLDVNGLNEEQRNEAIKLAKEYIGSGSTYVMSKKGMPGEPVDCSGLISKCVIVGEENDPNEGKNGSGIVNIEQNTKKVEKKDLEEGNIVTFRNLSSTYAFHGGIITKVTRDENGNPSSIDIIHASSSANKPVEKHIELNNKNDYYAQHINGFYKWDTIPD